MSTADDHRRRKPPVPDDLLVNARRMRHEPTDAEQRMWRIVRGRRLAGFKFRRQHPLGRFILDFYREEAKLSLELDGGQHADPEQVVKDQRRTAWLASQGVRVLRFWDHHVLKYPDVIAGKIYDALMATPQGEGPPDDELRIGDVRRSPSP